ncbi:MAG: DUF1440 domain-containing protein [Candidatus Dormibacteraeota bacterium]|nr:DUF1440 domain-containing protein [Candidatus Dormibacteraeota bacterium]
MKRSTAFQAAATGMAAGVVGTGFMTAWQELAAKLKSSSQDGVPEPREPPSDPWEAASAPAKVAKRIGEGVLQRPISPDLIPLLTNGMHWGYGTSWGTVYGIAAGSARSAPGLTAGAAFGTMVWLMSYIQLVPMGLYDPPWKTPPQVLALDLSYHLVYGAGVAGAYRLLKRD